jgi:hypothetical protein
VLITALSILLSSTPMPPLQHHRHHHHQNGRPAVVRHARRDLDGVVIPLHDLSVKIVDIDGVRHIKGHFFIGGTWNGTWFNDQPTLYWRARTSTEPIEQRPFLHWSEVDPTQVTIRPHGPTGDPVDEGSAMDIDAIVPAGVPRDSMIAIEVDGRSERHGGLGDVLETSFVIVDLSEQSFVHSIAQPHARSGIHIFTDSIIPLDLHRPWMGEPLSNMKKLHFFSRKMWGSHYVAGYPRAASGTPALGSANWRILAMQVSPQGVTGNRAHGVANIDADPYSGIMVYGYARTTTTINDSVEIDGVIRDLLP